ncbi:unnamed protein product [Brachionus calyciflorus]|uniref:DNA-directed RNA polymerases I and III subunit RPAC1 n=1 Tax=Brachionus calyciflorus TaxID=104777 RepID=A0A813WQR5_9BILA|nr:unnamed protein product [Brachionus calyciflorus]
MTGKNTKTQEEIVHDLRTRVKLEEYGVENTQSTDYPGTYEHYDDSWDFEKFKKNFKIDIKSYSADKMEMEFDMIGIDASIANSFRRILLAEVPTMAIEKVLIYNNTSVIQDEILAHRLGLIPLKAGPSKFKFKLNPEGDNNEDDTLEYELKVKCKMPKNGNKEDRKSFIDSKVLSSHIKWNPIGNQAEQFKEEDVCPVLGDILVAKMNPGQELDLKLLAVKGIGKDHAKFSPVATAYYRLLTEIVLKTDFYDEQAEKLKSCFSPGVIKIVEDKKKEGRTKAVVDNPRLDTCSRQVYMFDEFKGLVEINKIRDHFLFSIESTGAVTCENLMKESINILMMKTQNLLNEINSKKN